VRAALLLEAATRSNRVHAAEQRRCEHEQQLASGSQVVNASIEATTTTTDSNVHGRATTTCTTKTTFGSNKTKHFLRLGSEGPKGARGRGVFAEKLKTDDGVHLSCLLGKLVIVTIIINQWIHDSIVF
jgi:hypothetical protein